MSNTKKNLISLRNAAIGWALVACALIVGLGFTFDIFSKLGLELEEHNNKKTQTINNILTEGIISDQKITTDTVDSLRLATIKNLVPNIVVTIGAGTSEEQKNLAIITRITKKDTSEKDYIEWLQTSWDAASKENLEKIQSDIAEIIPVFAGVSGISGADNTKHITGKITLRSLIDFIQNDIAAKYHFGHAVGSIGIDGVRFSTDGSEIGAYDIPLNFNKVNNEDVINLLEFLARTGGIQIQKMENNQFSIRHIYPREESKNPKQETSLSQLKNPLILINSISLSPSGKDASLSLEEKQEWNIALTLTFYIRGVSSDHLVRMDQVLNRDIGTNQTGELIMRATSLLSKCKNKLSCSEENKISDMINLFNAARDTYKSILSSDTTGTPIARVKRRSDLMTTVAAMQNKLIQLEDIVNNTP